jgi:hypothetical protein
MRWFVDVSSVGKTAEKLRYCVEAESWQRALQTARELRDDPGPMTGFSIELLDDGFSAIDPIKRQKYAIRKAPADEELSVRGTVPPPAPKEEKAPKSVPEKSKGKTAPQKLKGAISTRPPPASEKADKPTSTKPSAGSSQKELSLSPAPAPARAPAQALENGASRLTTPIAARPGVPRVSPSQPPASGSSSKSTPPPPEAADTGPMDAPPSSVSPSKPPSSTSRSSRPPAPDLQLMPRGKKGGSPGAQVVSMSLPVLAKREQDPGADGPLTYREYAYYVEVAPDRAEGERLLRHELEGVKKAIAGAQPGKLVNMALFDVRFTGRPPKLPLVTLTWKDWREDAQVTFPNAMVGALSGVAKESAPPPEAPPPEAPPQAALPPPAAPTSSDDRSLAAAGLLSTATVRMSPEEVTRMESSAPPPEPVVAPSAPPPPKVVLVVAPSAPPPSAPPPSAPVQGFPVPVVPTPPPSNPSPVSLPPESLAPPTTRGEGYGEPVSARAPTPRPRLRGDELIADLFEAMHDLQFLRDAIEGADFCLTLALEKMPARGGIVHLYDIDRRQFVITCAGGVGGETLLSQRSAENDAILFPTMRRRRAFVLADATTSEVAQSMPRYAALGGAKSLIVAPVALGGRFLGAIELLNPVDEVPFTDDDGHALSYIAEQLASFVGQRGILLERERDELAAPAAAPPKSRRSVKGAR